jgi:fucose permease
MVAYNASAMAILMLSMSFMVFYLLVSVPASYVIDTYGIRTGVGIGALLTGVFGLLRGIYASDLNIVLMAQVGLAVGQPFILNAITKVSATWFPASERATASGVPIVAQFVGIIAAFLLSPLLLKETVVAGAVAYDTKRLLMSYGYASLMGAIVFLVFVRDQPAAEAVGAVKGAQLSFFAGLKRLFKQRDMILLVLVFLIGLGLFNSISTFIELILVPKGLGKVEAGQVGGIMMVAGIIGAALLPALSDRFHTRKMFLVVCLIGSIPGLVGLTFASSYSHLMVSSFVFGFFLIGVAPIGFQYSAEVSYPVPEATSQGMVILAGQIGGIALIALVGLLGHVTLESVAGVGQSSSDLTLFMIIFIMLSIGNVILSLMLSKPPRVQLERYNE